MVDIRTASLLSHVKSFLETGATREKLKGCSASKMFGKLFRFLSCMDCWVSDCSDARPSQLDSIFWEAEPEPHRKEDKGASGEIEQDWNVKIAFLARHS